MPAEIYAQRSNEIEDANFQRLVSRASNASIFIPDEIEDSVNREASVVRITSPLNSVRMSSSSQQASGPSYAANGTGDQSQQNRVMTGNNVVQNKIKMFSAFHETSQNHWNNNDDRKNEHLLRSGKLGMCNDPCCTTCPAYLKAAQHGNSRISNAFDQKFHNDIHGDSKVFTRNVLSFYSSCIHVVHPHTNYVLQWKRFLAVSTMVAIFLDPFFFFLFYVKEDLKCVAIDWQLNTTVVVLRSFNDLIYFLNILLQFKLAYISTESTMLGARDLVDHPKKIAQNYLLSYFFLDLLLVIPLPQIMVLFVVPNYMGSSGMNYAKNLVRASILVQYIPRLMRFLPLLWDQSPAGFIFTSVWESFIIHLLIFILSGHIVGANWYLFGLQRVNQCLFDACHNSNITGCMEFIDCEHSRLSNPSSHDWNNNVNATTCFSSLPGAFTYGIYANVVPLAIQNKLIKKYVYSLFWGFQQICTLAGNQTPSSFEWEVLFVMSIIGLGLFHLTVLIGRLQSSSQGLVQRRVKNKLRECDVEEWMSDCCLPEDLKWRIRRSEKYNWAATKWVKEEMLMENMSEDLQRDIRRHVFKFIKKVRILALMDEPIFDAICERLRRRVYIRGSNILCRGDLVEQMVFVVHGRLESIDEDGTIVCFFDEDACGEELLIWCLENLLVSTGDNKLRPREWRLHSSKTVTCLTDVRAFSLRAVDLEEVITLFARFLPNPSTLAAIRYELPYWRYLAASRIQLAWRYKKNRLRATSQAN